MSRGRILILSDKYLEAQAVLESAIKSNPRFAPNYYFLGIAQQSVGLSYMAKSTFARALRLHPEMPEAAAALAHLDANNGDYDEALRMANIAIKANPNWPSTYVVAARAWFAKGNAQQGETLLHSALERDPTSIPALSMLLDRDARRGRAQEAVQQISGLTQRYPQSAGLWFLLGVGYFDLKDLEKSEADIRRALALDAKTPGAYTVLAEIDFAKGSADKAELNLRAAIEANPRSIVNYVALESLYESENHWDEAMRLSERAHQIDPNSPIVANQLAYLYLEHGGDVNDAVTLAKMAKQKMPDSPQAADTLGWAYYKSGAPESAVLPLRESVRKVPNNATYQYHLGMAYMAGGHLDSAERCLRQALGDDPKFPDAALARVALGKISKGIAVR